MTLTQLELFDVIGGGDAVPAPELAKGIPVGAERLLAALVRGGLSEDAFYAGATVALLMDEPREAS